MMFTQELSRRSTKATGPGGPAPRWRLSRRPVPRPNGRLTKSPAGASQDPAAKRLPDDAGMVELVRDPHDEHVQPAAPARRAGPRRKRAARPLTATTRQDRPRPAPSSPMLLAPGAFSMWTFWSRTSVV